MAYQKSELYFLITLIVAVCFLVFFIFQPFIFPLLTAVIFATVFEPVHKRILTISGDRQGLAALLSTIFILVVIVVPVTFLSTQIFKEATQVYSSIINNGGASGISRSVEIFIDNLGIPLNPGTLNVGQYAKDALTWVVQNLGSIFSNVVAILIDVLILLVALFFVFRDGDKIKKTIIALSPLQDVYDEAVFNKLKIATNSVVRGSIAIALLHGVFSTIGLTIFAVPNSVLWGSVAAVAALVPGLGTSLVLVPAIVFLLVSHPIGYGIGLLVWWVIELNIVDNALGPKLMGRGVKLPPFLILLSVFGGINMFGPVGFLFGPLLLSLLLALLEIYSLLHKGSAAQ